MSGIQDCQKSESALNASQLIGIEKRCKRCGKNKSLSSFVKDKRTKGVRKGVIAGFTAVCKQCEYERTRKWWLKNPERTKTYSADWRKKNPERSKTIGNRAALKQRNTPKKRLSKNISSCMHYSLKRGCGKNKRHWEAIVGYTIEQLVAHLEKQFKDGMTWDNYGKKGWWVDHKIPVSVFNFEKPEDDDFKRCWALKNLQPMWAIENIKKYNKIKKPIQPMLIFNAKTGLQR